MTRPLFQQTLEELEAQVGRNVRNDAELALVEQELRKRTTRRARELLAQVSRLRAECTPRERSAPAAAEAGKYALVHAAATAAGSPILLGWKHAGATFLARSDQHTPDSVYGTIFAITREAGAVGITAAGLATSLRQRQIGNRRSQYCDGLPPIGWAEGWIDTAVTRGIIVANVAKPSSTSAASTEAVSSSSGSKLNIKPDPTTGRPRIVAPPPAPPRKPKPMTEARRWTEEAVASLRTKLIDLGKKSPLISFKHGGRSASILRIVDERPDLLCAAIAKGAVGFEPLPAEDETPRDELTPAFKIAYERARLTNEAFLAATDKLGDDERDAKGWQQAERALRAEVRRQLGLPALDYGKTLDVAAIARAHGFDPSFDLRASDDDDVAAHHEDDKLRVLLTAKELDKRLKTIAERYGSHKRETGLHTLFMVLGFVQWFEDNDSDVTLHAPLLLRDVDLVRKAVAGHYVSTLTPGEDGLQVNVALAEKMRQHWSLELPPLRPEEAPESYFIRVEAVLAKGRRLSLRRFATLAVLPFPRMVLWKDLDPAAWPDAAFAEHRLLPGLLGAVQVAGEASLGETIDVDAPEWAKRAPALIRPADASQHSALIDVGEGHDLAIEGPPGTGKSETITNMIATALAAGRRVLFVAEKQAALRVVADRLRASGFGSMLLELHGDNAHRADVYDGLRERLKTRVRVDQPALDSKRFQLAQQRELLRRYLALIDQELGALGRTAYWLAWREIHLRHTLGRDMVDAVAARFEPYSPRTVDRGLLASRRDRLDTFGAALSAVHNADQGGERTRWVEARQLDPFDQGRQLQAAAEAGAAAATMARAGTDLQALAGVAMPGPGGTVDAADAQLASLVPFEPVEDAIALATLRHPDTARALLRQQARWRQLCGKLAGDIAAPASVGSAAIDELATAIDGIRPVPLSVAVATERLEATTDAATIAEASASERRLLADRLGLDPSLTVEATRVALQVIDALGREPATVMALYRSELLDPLAEAALHGERLRAAALREERQALASDVTEEAAETEPGEMIRIADVLVESGAFARLFGGAFKAARRHAGQLVRDPADRLATAELLRRMARQRNHAAAFHRESVVAGWFPALLWKGADSDWDAIQRARAVLIDARRQLAEAGADTVLARWLALSSDERVRVAAAVARVLPMLEKAASAGLGAYPVAGVGDVLASRQQALEVLTRALAAVGALPDGQIVRDGEDLADRLEVLEAAADEFAALAAQEEFAWVGNVGAPLEPLARALAHSDMLRELDGPLPIVATLVASEEPVALLGRVIAAGDSWREAARAWRTADRQLEEIAGLPATTLAPTWETLEQLLAAIAADETGARLAADLLRYGRALDEVDLTGLRRAALDGLAPADRLADLYELLLVRTLLHSYLGADGAELGRVAGGMLDKARENFTRIDKELHALEAKAIVAKRLADKPPLGVGSGLKSQYTEMELIESELGLRRPRTPLRDVVHRAGAALQTLKPVWMMSPTSAAQYIRPATLSFDLLVVDEASQMRPEFSISSVLRGSQFVVVGDANQLPPSDHFQMGGDDGADDDAVGVTQDTESILDLANQRFRRKRRLKWHYRSQHESLIQFSNREFYESDLVVFPSPMGNDDELLGVKCRYVSGAVYEASINQREAEAVIEEAFRLMRAYPQHSLGIAAMNAKQTELIQNEFDRLILEQPEIRRYIDEYAGGVEEFFIKNLENVQGDERDIILISTVYGPNKDGKVLQNFGLMNREVGWRRLNVLVTRAKLSTRLFTSLRPDDVKVTSTSSRGVRAFKAYLTYAHGGASYQDASGGEPDSDFELFVADALRGARYEVVHQVGVEGFRIDLGVRHPDYPIGFIAGVECDGASFHRGLTVRDRDRIRQSVLEGMGWKIYRIWSTDWFADPSRELSRLIAFLEEQRGAFAADYAKRPKPSGDPTPVPEPSHPSPDQAASIGSAAEPPPLSSAAVERSGPTGRAMRPLGEIAWYETIKGQSYEVWLGERLAGDVEVLSRATAAPRLYGNQMVVARSEYEGHVEASGERFLSHDIHAAVREVARRAQAT